MSIQSDGHATQDGGDSGFGRGFSIMAKKEHVFHVTVEQDEAGYYVAECPALRACYTQGKTYEEVIDNIKDVIALCLEEDRFD
jgi:predicted RNase H-like HicB family nuclease